MTAARSDLMALADDKFEEKLSDPAYAKQAAISWRRHALRLAASQPDREVAQWQFRCKPPGTENWSRWRPCEDLRDVEDIQRHGTFATYDAEVRPLYAASLLSGAGTKSDGGPPNWREVEMMRLIDLLRSEEGDSVTILCDNPDPRTEAENNAVVCNGGWTNYEDRRFSGVGLLDALSAAMIEYKRPKSVGIKPGPSDPSPGPGVREALEGLRSRFAADATHPSYCPGHRMTRTEKKRVRARDVVETIDQVLAALTERSAL